MNEQQLQQILTIQQAIAAAATAAVINSLLNPQQAAAANLTNQNALTESSPADNDSHEQHHPDSRQGSPMTSNSPSANNPIDTNNRTIQDLLLQLQQQANLAGGGGVPSNQMPIAAQQAVAAAALNFNLNNQIPAQSNLVGSPISRLLGQNDFNAAALAAVAAATTSGNITQQSSQLPNHSSSGSSSNNNNKKIKRNHQSQISPQQHAQPFPSQHNNRSSIDATSKPLQQHSLPKGHSTIPNLSTRNSTSGTNSSSSSSTFLPNNVGLPRKLVRGQDVWLGRGAEQTRQILKCMWCGQSFRTLAEMTQHMKVTQHYTNIISQEQITSWKQPESNELTPTRQPNIKQSMSSRNLDESHDTSSEKFNDSDKDDSFSNDEEPPQRAKTKNRSGSATSRAADRQKTKRESTSSADIGDSAQDQSSTVKSSTRSRKRQHDDTDDSSEIVENTDFESAENLKTKNNSDSNDEAEKNDEIKREATSPEDYSKTATDDEQDKKSEISRGRDDEDEEDQKRADDIDGDNSAQSNDRDKDSKSDHSADEAEREEEEEDRYSRSAEADAEIDEECLINSDECDKTPNKKRSRAKPDIVATIDIKQGPGEQRGDGSGDPLSALETMVEKSFDPRMRPGMASGGILQRLGIDEEVCPPWQHLNYANWYAAAAYGHPMATALLAAGINLQNGIKLSRNMNSKKSDD